MFLVYFLHFIYNQNTKISIITGKNNKIKQKTFYGFPALFCWYLLLTEISYTTNTQ